MRSLLPALLLVSFACSDNENPDGEGPIQPPEDEETAVDPGLTGDTAVTWDTDLVSDTALRETGGLNDTNDTFRGVIPGTPTGDTADTSNDTGPDTDIPQCGFGEVLDCNNICYPEYYLGDGYCDDGIQFPADFACDYHANDRGDCDDGSDTGVFTGGDLCPYILRFNPTSSYYQMSFDLQEHTTGNSIVSASSGFLTQSGVQVDFPIWLYDGTYDMYMYATWNNWGGGTYTLLDANGTELYTGTAGFDGDVDQWELDCAPDTGPDVITQCSDISLTINTSSIGEGSPATSKKLFAGEIRWEILDEDGNIVDSVEYDTYDWSGSTPSINVTTHDLNLEDGTYTFRMYDSYGNTWDGATYQILDGRNLILSNGSKNSSGGDFGTEHSEDKLFTVACDTIYVPPPITVDCNQLDLQIISSTTGDDIGFGLFAEFLGQLIDVDAGDVPAAAWSFDTYQMSSVEPGWSRSDWVTGDYTVHLIDAPADGSTPNGWSATGDRVQLYNISTGEVYREWGAGFDGGFTTAEFSLVCTNLIEEEPEESNSECTAGTIEDCDGVCWPSSYLGDDFCDDGDLFAPNFYCDEHDYDDGDCPLPEET